MTLLKNERVMIFLDSFTAADLLILIIILFAFGAFMFKSRNNVKNYLEAYRLKKNSKEKALAQITTNEEAIKKSSNVCPSYFSWSFTNTPIIPEEFCASKIPAILGMYCRFSKTSITRFTVSSEIFLVLP